MNVTCITGAKVLLKTIEKLRRKNRAVIVTGDFNAAPGQGSYEVLRDGTAAVLRTT
jgi:endonuclease/exonuclease/phosphatase family metal-dependent hydrolase